MFGIGGGEFLFIMIVALMFFGSDKIPEIARALGKGMAQLRNATNDVKAEIQKGIQENGLDKESLTGGIAEEINKAKEGFTRMVYESNEQAGLKSELDQIRENFSKINTDLNPPAQQPVLPETTAAEVPQMEIPAEPIVPEGHDGPIKRQV